MNKTGFYKIRNLFIVISACLALNLTTAKAQTARLSIHLDRVPIERVVNEIEQQSRYLFLFNKDIDSTQITVSVDATDSTVPDILPLLFAGTGLDYTIEGRNILVTKAEQSAKNVPSPVQVTGKVTDTTGEPVIGASVVIKGTTLGTSPGFDGSYSLQIPP
ncbi:MAG: carboxypeptidase-like regulatory domain-containing protein, partial [Alistipes sp.]|nr:carboxypeptidase-like regulatory domain-containing protein [Alistipes sp.]